MATVTERWMARKLTKGAGGWRFVRIFDVTQVGTEDDAIAAVESHDASTAFNASPDVSPLLYVSDRDGEQIGFRFWTVTITYSSSPEGRFFDHGNPLNEPTKWRVIPATEQTCSSIDAYGLPTLNAVGQAFSSDPPAFKRFITLVGQRCEPFFDLQKALQFTNAVNNVALTFDGKWPLAKGQACCRSVQPLSSITGAEPYVVVEYIFELRGGSASADDDGYFDGFKLRILNEGTDGFYDTEGHTGKLCRLVQDSVTKVISPDPISYPVLLDQYGVPLVDNYVVLCPKATDSRGYIEPVSVESIGFYAGSYEIGDHAVFIKMFPDGIQFRNLADLGL